MGSNSAPGFSFFAFEVAFLRHPRFFFFFFFFFRCRYNIHNDVKICNNFSKNED